MKRMAIFGAAVTCAVVLSGCDWIENVVLNTGSIEATETKTWSYTSDNPFLEIDSSVLKVNVSGDLGGKTLYYTTVNPSTSTISSSSLRKITASAAAGSTSSSTTTPFPHFSRSAEDIAHDFGGRKHFVGEKLPPLETNAARSALSAPSYVTTTTTHTWEIGEERNIYVDNDSEVSTFVQKSAHLRAASTNCYVWVIDDYYTSGEQTKTKINTATAQKFAEKFEAMYPVITHIFGNESNQIYDYDNKQFVAMNGLSETDTKINIVVYDIGGDATGLKNQNGIVGYFYAKDYYYSAQERTDLVGESNVGKYFYIDSAYAVSDFDDTISTLAHEFQHMVNFGVKEIDKELDPDTSYNEMLSMLCEDMMQEFLGLDDDNAPKNRTQGFNAYYFYSGIREYLNNSNAVLSYSTSYLFGAWLCRRYGGAALVQEIMSNKYVNDASLVRAVNTLNGTNYTMDDLMREFAKELYGITTYLNKNAAETILYSSDSLTYTYPMTAFDIFANTYSPKSIDGYQKNMKSAVYSGYDYTGPFLFANDIYNVDLRPLYGMQLHGVGTYASGTTSDTITFSDAGAEDLVIYPVIK